MPNSEDKFTTASSQSSSSDPSPHPPFWLIFVSFNFRYWIEHFPADWNEKLIANLNNFIDNTLVGEEYSQLAKQLRNAIAKRVRFSRNFLYTSSEKRKKKGDARSTTTFWTHCRGHSWAHSSQEYLFSDPHFGECRSRRNRTTINLVGIQIICSYCGIDFLIKMCRLLTGGLLAIWIFGQSMEWSQFEGMVSQWKCKTNN